MRFGLAPVNEPAVMGVKEGIGSPPLNGVPYVTVPGVEEPIWVRNDIFGLLTALFARSSVAIVASTMSSLLT
jgi:hypothetical protein